MQEVIVSEAAVRLGIWNDGILLAGFWKDFPHQLHRMQLSPIQGTPSQALTAFLHISPSLHNPRIALLPRNLDLLANLNSTSIQSFTHSLLFHFDEETDAF